MTLLTTLVRRPARAVRALLGDDSDDYNQLGPEAIAAARRELTEDSTVSEGRIGEAHLADYSGEFSKDVKAVVPVHTDRYEDPAPMLFDVDGDELAEFCAAYGVDVDTIGALEGATVPIRWEQGTPVPAWREIGLGFEEVTA